ncbi:DUF1613 domain-containing protein [Crucibulum laeve]|uniref:tRNA (uracil-O(2)-)-methyltransferase n=1 Tax=Crucibulum laeve TaxID=68775 RepID=A0A5C3LKZ4_9AGAR|nr:DUF1613 domain-containing protein [Crucibulum laeve]
MASQPLQRARFEPQQWSTTARTHSPLSTPDSSWTTLISCAADFPIELFEIALSQLIHHPEYNSTLILRSDVIAEITSHFPEKVPTLEGFQPVRCIHRKLQARRPGRDASLEQYCTLYSPTDSELQVPTVLVLTPIVPPGSTLPYYHPAISHLAFRYLSSSPPTLLIEALPLPNTPTDPNSRLYRTCLALLETLHRYGWGAMTNYKKRVQHDCLVPRDAYQDLYLLMRERHKGLVDTWQEVTDPLKHVFEDIGIATYLMLLWKDTFAIPDSPEGEPNAEEPWKSWPRPPGGFLDLGCGNGLLTHILTAEGYAGSGIDLRARTSWDHYPLATQANLHVHAFDPTLPISSSSPKSTASAVDAPAPPTTTATGIKELAAPDPYFKPGVFLIGNHADELTPWVPVLATLHNASGYISIPCCAWSFDAKFERSSTPSFPIPSPPLTTKPVPSSHKLSTSASKAAAAAFAETLNLGGDGSNTSSYSQYRIWLASLSLHCGWQIECETLRIPSTRNWAIVGELADITLDEAMDNVRGIVESVKERGIFKTRKPEGKAGEH